MYAEITAAIASIKALAEIAKLTSDIKTSAQVLQETVNLNITILALQEKMSVVLTEKDSLLQEKKELEQKIAEFDHWETESARYELKEIALSVLVYTVKPGADIGEPTHWLCAKCYKDKRPSIIQRQESVKSGRFYLCPVCKIELHFTPGWFGPKKT
ncbi:MAG: hypothetical protein AABO57_07305 [Acidobacteriota bacterium]